MTAQDRLLSRKFILVCVGVLVFAGLRVFNMATEAVVVPAIRDIILAYMAANGLLGAADAIWKPGSTP